MMAPENQAALLREIGPLPLSAQAWTDGVRILTWIILAIAGAQLAFEAIQADPLSPVLVVGIVLCFLVLITLAWHMQVSITTIDEQGLRQSWIKRREVAWQDIRCARYLSLPLSKRLLIITRQGRALVFQGGTRELRHAFEKIAQLYRDRAE
ncbi:hypothetical protein [Bordetella avium]|uniref:hypothetical protein n=1 Tax=Bordetella avium TaxID=521 RepID=UPI000E0C83BE|nr:hypothetical protein [Bordetella avium]AZY47868.1 hypothetical protein C0J09_01005 [Bordetella avium]AZY51240.1 hypothetical protein C0J07_01015 [Bordetella avium]RIQ14905.1 hypothetical protein D0432_01915 [Bordetella avium]RIQ18604.1 hypothetical protein D0850_05925 [Bordetella avium]RIQ35360.1 hypothetical protein D0849_05015 [Bordetella avium]